MNSGLVGLVAVGGACSLSLAAGVPMTIDFGTDDGGNALVNGQEINVGEEFGNVVDISSPTGDRLSIFDTDVGGPNDGGPDGDLIVDLGNALIIQEDSALTQSVADIFDVPNDEASGGEILFTFMDPVELESITLIDINGNRNADLYLTDGAGRIRTYNVPEMWTNDVQVAPEGFGVLDLTILTDQGGEGAGGPAVASEDAGFDPTDVRTLLVDFGGSAALDNLVIVPSPGVGGLLALGGLAAMRRRR